MKILKGNINDWQIRFRLWAALVMASYVITHTINIGLGLISLEAMNAYQYYILLFWRSWPLYWLVITAIVVHVSLGLWKLFKRNTLKMPFWEKSQIILGACVPFFLLAHITFTRGMHLLFGVHDTFTYEFIRSFPGGAWRHLLLIIFVWAHAQIGVHFVLRMRPWYPRIRALIIAVFIITPMLGIAGYIKAGIDVTDRAKNSQWLVDEKLKISWPTEEQIGAVQTAGISYYIALPFLYASILGARGARLRMKRNLEHVRVSYSSGRHVMVAPQTTILEASRIGNIPHASICGGRGRCSTCRVRVDRGIGNLTAPGERESHVLALIEAEPNVRLACQAACGGDITVTQLLPPDITATIARKAGKYSTGRDVSLVVMFSDLRGFTALSEGRLPYDVVFMLNRYFTYMGEAIEENGGYIDKFLGDGIMALFGLDTDLKTACKQSLAAAQKMARRLDEINEQLKQDLKDPLKLGIGLHVGEVILGEMGYKNASKLTAIGDTVNTASRLEVLNKKASSQLIFSRRVAEIGGIDVSRLESRKILIRGKENPIDVFIIRDINSLNEIS